MCDRCTPEKLWKYHGARYIIPFSLEFPHFEVIMQYLTSLPNFPLKKWDTDILVIVTHSLTHAMKPVKMKTNIAEIHVI